MIRAFAIDAVGNLAFFALGYYWLGLPSSSAGYLALTTVIALILAALAAYLIAFAFNRDARAALSRIPVMLIWLAVAGAACAFVMMALGYVSRIDNWFGSALTLATRTPIQVPYSQFVFLGLAVLFFAMILLPAAARAVDSGSLRDFRPLKGRGYLVATAVYLVIGLWIPWKLFWWIPTIGSFGGQMASFAARIGLAFSLYVGAWLVFAWHCRTKALSPESEHAR